ncbi:MAG: hypothetical protein WC821_00865 [archaeon]|jgi:hypothetical protein
MVKPRVNPKQFSVNCKQLDFFANSKKVGLIPNRRLGFVKRNIASQRAILLMEREAKKAQSLSTKISAYELAWRVINSGGYRVGDQMINEAWHIVKALSPAKGKNKIGAGAGFKRIRGATTENPKELEIGKLSFAQAQRFIKTIQESVQYPRH